jgi:formyl-CoA transferase
MEAFMPLSGIRVLDFTHVIAGPMATFYLQQMGAKVTKIENRHGGDVMRRGDAAMAFVALNAGKASAAFDLSDDADRARLFELADQADVLVDSLRPGVLDKFGFGADALRARNPRLIYTAISGFGRRGPWANRPAYDHIIQSISGMAMLSGRDGDAPIKAGGPIVDAATGILAALAIVAALRERDQTGRGRFIDVAMTAAAMQLMYPLSCDALTRGASPSRQGNQGYSRSPAADVFELPDGWVALGANTPRQFMALLRVLDRVGIASDPAFFETPLRADAPAEFLRAKDPAALRAALVASMQDWRCADLEQACMVANVPAARVRTIGDFAAEARAADGLGLLDLEQDGVRVTSPGLGFRVS